MLKKILIISAAILLGTYAVFAALFLRDDRSGTKCSDVTISIDCNDTTSLTAEEIVRLLKGKKIYPLEKDLGNIDCTLIEKAVLDLSIVEDCKCYKTHKNTLAIDITCKTPVMRVFSIGGDEYLIDDKGNIIEGTHNAVYLPVASGYIKREMAQNEILQMAQFLEEEEFWNEQIEQVYFTQKNEIVLVPRVGDHIIELGSISNLEEKLNKLKDFYDEGLNRIGWNKYSKLNIEFDNKVIGTKK